ncbi:hypothetical protein WDW89_04570 [Deltaproteobacteria bacterium TL4]
MAKKKIEWEAEFISDPQHWNEAIQELESQAKVELCLPEDLLAHYRDELRKRFSALNLHVSLEKLDNSATQESETAVSKFKTTLSKDAVSSTSTSKYDYQLSFDYLHLKNIPSLASLKGAAQVKLPFSAKGLPAKKSWSPLQRQKMELTRIEKRSNELSKAVLLRERNVEFVRMAYMHAMIRQLNQSLSKEQKILRGIEDEISHLAQPYYEVLSFVLLGCVEKVTGVISLEGIMKRLIKVIVIDDLGELTLKGMAEKGFSRKYLASMSMSKVKDAYNLFLAANIDHKDLEKLTLKHFINQSDLFDKYDIIVVNLWHLQKETLPIWIRLRLKTILGRKEQLKDQKDPEKIIQETEAIESKCEDLKLKLEEVKHQLSVMETGKVPAKESEYRALESKRKRLLNSLKREMDRLKKAQPLANVDDRHVWYTKDLLSTLKDNQTFKERLGDTFAKLQWRSMKSLFSSERHLTVHELQKVVKLSREKAHIEEILEKLQKSKDQLVTAANGIAEKHGWSQDLAYESCFDTYLLDLLERDVLVCCIAHLNSQTHLYQGGYFQTQKEAGVPWSDDRLSQISVYIASKKDFVSTAVLRQVFKIPEAKKAKPEQKPDQTNKANPPEKEEESRLVIKPVLPQREDFLSNKIQLLLIDLQAFSVQDIGICLTQKKLLKDLNISVILFDSPGMDYTRSEILMLNLLVGVKSEEELITPVSPPYHIQSLGDENAMRTLLDSVMGIPRPASESQPHAAA